MRYGWVLLVVLVGCEDLPDAQQVLMPTSSAEVVKTSGGWGEYKWQIENGNFPVTRPLDSSLLDNIDQAKVAALIPQLLTRAKELPTYSPPDGASDALKKAIEAYLHPDATASDVLFEIKELAGGDSLRFALNESGSRLLVAGAKLAVWDVEAHKLISERPLPTPDSKFVFLDADGEHAFVFGNLRVWKITLADGTTVSKDLTNTGITAVVAATAKEQFLINCDSGPIMMDYQLQSDGTPLYGYRNSGSLAVSYDGQFIGQAHDGALSVLNTASSSQTDFTTASQFGTKQTEVIALGGDVLAVGAHEIFSTHDFVSMGSFRVPSANRIGLRPSLYSGYRIEAAYAASDETDSWLIVGALTEPDPSKANYLLFDVDAKNRRYYSPTVVGRSKPTHLAMSSNGKVFATLYPGQPLQVRTRHIKSNENQYFISLIETLDATVEAGDGDQAEAVMTSLQRYAQANPCVQTRPLLDLTSPVAESLASRYMRGVDPRAPNALPSMNKALEAWVAKESKLARLFTALRIADLEYVAAVQSKVRAHNRQAAKLAMDLLAEPDPPLSALGLFAQLTWLMEGNAQALDPYYGPIFERDPLNPSLHLIIGHFFGPGQLGEVGQTDAYFKAVSEILPERYQEVFYACSAARYLDSIRLPYNSSGNVASSRLALPLKSNGNWTLTSGFAIPTTRQNAGLQRNLTNFSKRSLAESIEKLIHQDDGSWLVELNETAWSELVSSLRGAGDYELCKRLVEAFAREVPFSLTDGIAGDPTYIEAVKNKWK